MDERKLAIKLVSDVSAGESASDKFGIVPSEVSELISIPPEVDVAGVQAGSITAPLTFIGGSGGSQSQIRGWTTGKVITRIRVYSGDKTIKAYTVWLTDSNGVTYGVPGNSNYAEYTFQNGELITGMKLWGNGVGTRAGWIEFTTSRGSKFSYGMYGRDRQTAYPVEVASGVLVGCIFNHGSDIDAHGFWFLNAIDRAELYNVKYPTLTFDSAGITPKVLDRFQYTNNSTTPKNWDFTRTMRESTRQTWSITVSLTVHATVSVKAGIPLVAEVNSEFGWEVGSSSTYESSQTSEQEFHWSVRGVVQPGHRVDIKAVTRMGAINTPYEATMVVYLRNGALFRYPMRGTYIGVGYTGVQVVDDSSI